MTRVAIGNYMLLVFCSLQEEVNTTTESLMFTQAKTKTLPTLIFHPGLSFLLLYPKSRGYMWRF